MDNKEIQVGDYVVNLGGAGWLLGKVSAIGKNVAGELEFNEGLFTKSGNHWRDEIFGGTHSTIFSALFKNEVRFADKEEIEQYKQFTK